MSNTRTRRTSDLLAPERFARGIQEVLRFDFSTKTSLKTVQKVLEDFPDVTTVSGLLFADKDLRDRFLEKVKSEHKEVQPFGATPVVREHLYGFVETWLVTLLDREEPERLEVVLRTLADKISKKEKGKKASEARLPILEEWLGAVKKPAGLKKKAEAMLLAVSKQ